MRFDHPYEIGAWNVCARCGLGRDDHPDMQALPPGKRPETGTYETANAAAGMRRSALGTKAGRRGGRPPMGRSLLDDEIRAEAASVDDPEEP